MESRLGHDLSRVRIHTDTRARDSARAVSAEAYTVGRSIVFGSFAPDSTRGRRVLAHELAHVLQSSRPSPAGGPLTISNPSDQSELEAERVAAAATSAPGSECRIDIPARSAPGQLRRLGPNPGCTVPEAADIHQAIFDARGWLAKAVGALGESPLSARVLRSLRRNFGPTYGVAANAELIRNRLVAARSVLSTMPIACAGAEDATCATDPCGWATVGSRRSTICRQVTLAAGTSEVFQAGCVLHESFHATFSRFDVDAYSGWHGHSGSTPGYPGTGVDPLLNADSYTTLVMDLS